jgi:excinuclease ABC subunit C
LLVLDAECDDKTLAQLLGEQAGHAVKISTAASGERKQWLEMGQRNALLALQQRAMQQGGQKLRLDKLREFLDMPDLNRIECFDISHTMGEAAQASCVMYENLDMRTSQYRRYNITDITPGDDYAAMRQALTRRYRKLPSLSDETVKHRLVLKDQ